MGKVIGGGMPLAAFGAKRAVMEKMAPLGPVYQAGTLSGNPIATACGLATLREKSRNPVSMTHWVPRRKADGRPQGRRRRRQRALQRF